MKTSFVKNMACSHVDLEAMPVWQHCATPKTGVAKSSVFNKSYLWNRNKVWAFCAKIIWPPEKQQKPKGNLKCETFRLWYMKMPDISMIQSPEEQFLKAFLQFFFMSREIFSQKCNFLAYFYILVLLCSCLSDSSSFLSCPPCLSPSSPLLLPLTLITLLCLTCL